MAAQATQVDLSPVLPGQMATDGHSTQPNLEMPDSISLINRTLASSPAVTLSLTLTLSPPKISVSWIVMPTPALSQLLDAHLELYLARLQLERTQSPNTWAAYRTDLTQLRLWLAQGPCPDSGRAVEDDSATPSPPDPLTSQLLAYITQLHESGLSANSIARKTSAIRSFFQYILENQHISDSIDLLSASGPAGTPLPLGTPPLHDQDTEPQPQTLPVSQPMTRQVAQPMPGFTLPTLHNNPVDTLPRPRIERHLPQALPWEAVDQILNYVLSPFRTPPTLAARDRALVFLLYACGLRVSELCSLTTADYVRGSGYLRISGKGQKERICPVAQAALTHLDHWLDEERPKLNPTTSSILINHRGAPLSRQGVWKVLGSLGTGAGVEKKLHPHLFRHTFATHLLSGGAPLRTIQILLGHSDLSTTQIYTSVAPTELAETVLRCHPRGHPRRHPRGGPAQN